ncbi:MAG: hypothetical protein J0G33_05120 [Afipia felis]|nr:hypothetical protein [Afipia felis]
MRMNGRWMMAAAAIACGIAVNTPAQADWVPPFKGNDTGGIIAYALYQQGADIKTMATDHCARYGKIVKLTGVDPQYGGYISFACVWVPPGHYQRPLHAAY